MELIFKDTPKDLVEKFVDVLVRLPNLKTLELLGVTIIDPVMRELDRKCAVFPSICEITICDMYPNFINSCPNLESPTFRHDIGKITTDIILREHGAELKRIRGIRMGSNVGSYVECEFLKCLLIRNNRSMDLS